MICSVREYPCITGLRVPPAHGVPPLELSVQTLFLLPAALGLLGFVEPCSIGAHLIFLDTQTRRTRAHRLRATLVFAATRSLMAGIFGALASWLGQMLTNVQTGLWLLFGFLYLAIGLAFLAGRGGALKRGIDPAPDRWKHSPNPLVLGLAFGLAIPACAAPLLFGLAGLAGAMGSPLTGFAMMFIFGLFLSLPLLPIALFPSLARLLDGLAGRLIRTEWLTGLLFSALGLWAVWFALYVNPTDWAGQ